MPNCNARDSQGRLVYYDKTTGCLTVDFVPQPCYGSQDQFTDDFGETVSGQQVLDCLLNGVAYPGEAQPPPGGGPPPVGVPPPVDLSGVEAALAALTDHVDTVASDVTQIGTDITSQITSSAALTVAHIDSSATAIGGAISQAAGDITGAINGAGAGIQSKIASSASDTQATIRSTSTDIEGKIGSAARDTQAQIKSSGQQVTDAVNALGATITDAVNGIGSEIVAGLTPLINGLTSSIASLGNSILTGIEDTLNSILPSLLDTLSANTAALSDFVSSLQSTLATPTDVLGDVKTWISANWPATYAPIKDLLTNPVGAAIKAGIDALEGEALGNVDELLDTALNGAPWPDNIKKALSALRNPSHVVELLPLLLLLFEIARQAVGKYVDPWTEYMHQGGLYDSRTTLLTLPEVLLAQRRGLADQDDVYFFGRRHGYPDHLIDSLQTISTDRLTNLDYAALFLRGYLDETQLTERLTGIQFDPGDIVNLLNLVKFVPQPADLVRFLTRDAFIPEFVDRFGLDLEFPPLADPAFAKVGVDHDTAILYWRAHWELPSLTQAYEMYHRVSRSAGTNPGDAVQLSDGSTVYRGLASDDLRRLQRAQGVEPFWRDKQLSITFSPLTRVDIRRMHKTGVLADGQLEENYLNLGYSQENAQRLAQFTINLNKQEVSADLEPWRSGIRGHVTTAFEQGVLGADQLKQSLSDLGYTDSQVAAFVAEGELVRAVNFASAARAGLKNLYVKGLETADDVRGELESLGFDDVEISEYFQLWDIDRKYAELTDEAKAQREATKAEIITAYKDRIISAADARGFLKGLKYADDAVSLLLNLADYQVAAADTAARVAAVKSLYVAGRVDYNNAAARLDQLTLSSERKQALLDTWGVERSAKAENVPLGVMERLVGAKLIDFAEAKVELVTQGYSASRADQILALFGSDEANAAVKAKQQADAKAAAAARQAAAEARRVAAEQRRLHPVLTEAQIVTSAKDGTFTVDEAMVRLLALGYSTDDAVTLVTNAVGPIEQVNGVWQMTPQAPTQ